VAGAGEVVDLVVAFGQQTRGLQPPEDVPAAVGAGQPDVFADGQGHRANDPRGIAQCLEALAHVASERAHFESVARLIGAAAALREQVAARQSESERARSSAVEQVTSRALGVQDADTLIHAGRTMPVAQAEDLALAVALGAEPGDADRSDQVPLTPRARQVAALVASCRTNQQIGRVLGISEKTAEVHLHHVMSKLDARSRAEVAAWAATHQLSAAA
jgi:DNA-binding NarL/FixJ family response regulator